MKPDEIEAEVRAKGLTAPRIGPVDIELLIVGEQYHVFADTTLTVACLTLKNGFTVTGESACASPENFNAKQKVWALAGYSLREVLSGTLKAQ